MALPIFTTFYPTAVKWVNAAFSTKTLRIIQDNRTGAPIGIVSPNANGPEGIWAPTPLTLAQIEAPTAAMLADLNATYQLDSSPYNRYRSDGIQLVPLDGEGGTVVPPGINVIWFSPITVIEGQPILIQGGVRIIQ